MVFNSIINKSIFTLSEFWRNKDRKAFMDFCFMDKKVFGIPEREVKKPNTKKKYRKRKHKKHKSKD